MRKVEAQTSNPRFILANPHDETLKQQVRMMSQMFRMGLDAQAFQLLNFMLLNKQISVQYFTRTVAW